MRFAGRDDPTESITARVGPPALYSISRSVFRALAGNASRSTGPQQEQNLDRLFAQTQPDAVLTQFTSANVQFERNSRLLVKHVGAKLAVPAVVVARSNAQRPTTSRAWRPARCLVFPWERVGPPCQLILRASWKIHTFVGPDWTNPSTGAPRGGRAGGSPSS